MKLEKTINKFKHFSEKGYKHYTENTIKELDELPLDNHHIITEFTHLREWLRDKHGIWVEVRHIKTFGVNRFHIIIWKYGEEDYHTIHCGNGVGYEVWDTPQEAYSAAFDYIRLNNLI